MISLASLSQPLLKKLRRLIRNLLSSIILYWFILLNRIKILTTRKTPKRSSLRFQKHMQSYLIPIKGQHMIIHLLLHLLGAKADLDHNKVINGKIQNSARTSTISQTWVRIRRKVVFKTISPYFKVLRHLSHSLAFLFNSEHLLLKWLIKSSRMYFPKMKNSN